MTESSASFALLIFIRNPELGKVKTRLAKDLGDHEALRIYNTLLAHTRSVSLAVDADRYLFYSNFIDDRDDWSADAFIKNLQAEGDLGDKMLQAFALALQTHDGAIIVGSDCPGLNEDILQSALDQLKLSDFVLGPAIDGGYYLLGMKRLTPQLLLDMTWSTEDVLAETIRRITKLGSTYSLLPTLSDIDYAEDWEKYGGLIDGDLT